MIGGDTIAAIATAPGRGGIAVVRVSGPEAFEIAEKVASADGRMVGWSDDRMTNRLTARHALFHDLSSEHRSNGATEHLTNGPAGHVIDDGILLAFKAPHSYTGEDVVEFQCHGGVVTPARVLEACCAAGARPARRGEFTERAFLNGKLDYDQAESVLDLIDAKTARAADAALEGLSGRKARELKALYEDALDLSARLEHALDIAEDELPESFFVHARSSLAALHASLRAVIQKAAECRLLNRGALVVLAGPPNAGKSSLLNALIEEDRAIVSEVPGTTRDFLEVWLDLDGWPVRLVDTAGLRASDDSIESAGVRRAEKLIARADVVLMLDGGKVEEWKGGKVEGWKSGATHSTVPPFHHSTVPPFHSSTIPPFHSSTIPLLRIHSKCDLARGEGLNVSAKTGEGLAELKRAIIAQLESRVKASDAADTDLSEERLAVLREVLSLIPPPSAFNPSSDLVLLANDVRTACERLGALVGATYSADLLDNLFSRFCVGK